MSNRARDQPWVMLVTEVISPLGRKWTLPFQVAQDGHPQGDLLDLAGDARRS